jgi:excisionase family DNA binding protein
MGEADERCWLSVSEAAKAAGMAERTLYRHIKDGKLPAHTVNGVTQVEVEAVRALPAAKQGKAPSAAATPGGKNGGGKQRDPGELAALTFSLLEAGKHAVDIVRELKLPPEQVAAFLRDWQAMKEGHAANRTTEDRLRLLEKYCHELEEKIGAWEMYVAGQLEPKIDGISEYVRSLVALSADRFACDCGTRGMVALRVVCTQCGRDHTWGRHPR